jgi:hypothetical protein
MLNILTTVIEVPDSGFWTECWEGKLNAGSVGSQDRDFFVDFICD